MSDIAAIPLDELFSDRSESVRDVKYCEYALLQGVTRYGGPNHDADSVQDRLDGNLRIIAAIDTELARRGVNVIDMDRVAPRP